jgi:hypothetical protein
MNFQLSEALDRGIKPEKLAALLYHAQYQRDRQTEADIRLAGALMKTACDIAGDSHSDIFKIYNGLLHYPQLTPGHRKLASIVYMCLGRIKLRPEKVANPLARLAAGAKAVIGGATGLGPELLKTIAAGGAITGGATAAGLWAANRGITQEDDKLRELEIQRDTYNQLNAEVKAELARRKMAPTPENQAAAVDYLT